MEAYDNLFPYHSRLLTVSYLDDKLAFPASTGSFEKGR
jgi:hypothetical protein